MSYHKEGWLSRHIAQYHQASEEASTPAPTPTTPATKNKTKIPTTTFEFKCPSLFEGTPNKKGMILHCYLKHRFSVLKGMYLSETTVGTIARSSESRLGLPGGSGPQ